MSIYKQTIFSFLLITSFSFLHAQQQVPKQPKYFINAEYGLAGSFFVRSYDDPPAEFLGYKEINKKNFVGVAQSISAGMFLRNDLTLRAGINYQHFTKRVSYKDTLSRVVVILDHTIDHRDYMLFAGMDKNYFSKRNQYLWGGGIYLLYPRQEEITIARNFVGVDERDFKRNRLNELGAFVEGGYEYRFQPRVNLGIRAKFFYTFTANTVEAVSLSPSIKILF